MLKKPELSIVILSYNTRNLLKDCLVSLKRVKNEAELEIIVVDNASSDGSVEMLETDFPEVRVVKNRKNLGFAAGNNRARDYSGAEFILFLNSDTIVEKGTIRESLAYLKSQPEVGIVTCKILLPDGRLDKDARRSFITPWIGLTHLFLRLDGLLPKSKLLARYWYGYLSPNMTHEIDVAQGAYFLVRRKVLDEINWFDESYFLDGEDIDLCWRVKQRGWKIIYYPEVSIVHVKGASKGKDGESKRGVSLKERIKFRTAGVASMEIFYRKRLWGRYPLPLNMMVVVGIKIMKLIRIVRTLVLG